MVWIHGGALTVGESDDYNPASLVARGVVVVTLNYRLGALGFLAHPALTAESSHHASGNYGLLDQQAALRWVARNISTFGGNPRNVTIFGESAGGLSVHSHLASPLARGLFDRAIVESGAYQPVQATLASASQAGSTFASQAGCADDQSTSCLRSLPVATILAKQSGGAPNVDGYVLKQSIVDSFATGTFNRVPVIEGSNHDEWRLFVAQSEVQSGVPLSAAAYIPAIAATLGVSLDVATALAAKYPLSAYPSPSVALGAVGTDVIFACNSRRLAGLLSAHVPTYQYEFNDPNAPMPFFPPVSFPTGAYHAAEIQYVFDSGTALDPAQRALSRSMVGFWTGFARFGTPFWPAYHPGSDRFEDLVPGRVHPATGFAADHKCA
jgi:para-nitrobenzyl esterase